MMTDDELHARFLEPICEDRDIETRVSVLEDEIADLHVALDTLIAAILTSVSRFYR